MKNRPISFSFLALFLCSLVLSCVTKPRFTKIHKGSYEFNLQDTLTNILEAHATIIPSIVESEKPKEPTYFMEMRDSIPHLYMKHIAIKTDDVKSFTEGLAKFYKKDVEKEDVNERRIFLDEAKFRVNLSHIKTYYKANNGDLLNPSTRLEIMNSYLTLSDTSFFYISSVDKIKNEYEEIDLGTLSRKSNITFDGKLEGSGEFSLENALKSDQGFENQFEKAIASMVKEDSINKVLKLLQKGNLANSSSGKISKKLNATAALQIQDALEENLSLKRKKLKTGFAFSPNQIVVSQHGSPLNDISDNTIINFTLKPKFGKTSSDAIYRFSNLVNKENKSFNPIDSVVFSRIIANYIKCDNGTKNSNIELKGNMTGIVRIAQNRLFSTSLLEYDDKVNFRIFKGEINSPVLIFHEKEFCHDVFQVKIRFNQTEYFLYYQNSISDPVPLTFLDKDIDQNQIKAWIRFNIMNSTSSSFNKLVFTSDGYNFQPISDFKGKNFEILFK